MRIVLDTNVMISALLWRGIPHHLLLRLQFEAVSHMPDEDRRIVKALLDGMIVKYQTKQLVGNFSS